MRRAIDRLRDGAPLPRVLNLRIQHHEGQMGSCALERNRFCIDLDPAASLDTLAHEWAHALTWDCAEVEDHGPLWGVAYARCYRIVYEVD